jgi:WhiB family transcriptional regulator, redox-sensing transcriptional regulator
MLQSARIGRPASLRGLRPQAAGLGDEEQWNRVGREALCAQSSLDPDEWFPVSHDPDTARRQAAQAIAVCAACPVRADCLELSLRHRHIGQHGIWGGLLPAERAQLRLLRPLPGRRTAAG